MLFKFACPKCGCRLEADSALSGSFAECPECNTSVHVPPARVLPGTTLGGFRLERLLGRGGMGEVYLATQLSMERQVAVKILPAALTENEAFVNRFLQEVRTAAKLEHPNIVTAFDAGSDTGTYYLAMAYVDGVALDQKLKSDGALSEAEVLRVAAKLAGALHYAWEQFGILHRDIKPANIMLDRFGEPKLMDLGVAKVVGEDTGLTITGMALGTPNYMSPEQARGAADVDCRSDIYSLGCCMYHLLTGHPPYVGKNPLEVMNLHLTAPIPGVRTEKPGISVGVEALILSAMRKAREARPQTWPEFAAQLEALQAGVTVPMPARRPRAVWRTVAALALVLAVLAGLAGARALRRPRRGEPPAQGGPRPTVAAPSPPTASGAATPPAASGVSQAMDRVAELIIARDLKGAHEAWRNAHLQLATTVDPARLKALDAAVSGAIRIPERVADSLRDDVGKEIAVALRDSQVTLTVTEVKDHQVIGSTRRGGTTEPTAFLIRDLDLDEQMRRLGGQPDACPELTRGIVFLNFGRIALALASFRRAENPLGDAFIVAMERRRLSGADTALPRRLLREALPRSRPAAP